MPWDCLFDTHRSSLHYLCHRRHTAFPNHTVHLTSQLLSGFSGHHDGHDSLSASLHKHTVAGISTATPPKQHLESPDKPAPPTPPLHPLPVPVSTAPVLTPDPHQTRLRDEISIPHTAGLPFRPKIVIDELHEDPVCLSILNTKYLTI